MMRKYWILSSLLLVLALSVGAQGVGAEIPVADYVAPGDRIDLAFKGTPGSTFNIILSDSRQVLENVTLVFDELGQHMWTYTFNETAQTDIVLATATIERVAYETSFIVSRMTPHQLVATMRMMAENSKKQAESALIKASQPGQLIRELRTNYRDAVQLLADSRGYADQGDHAKAFEEMKKALRLFESVIDGTYSTRNPPATSQDDQDTVRAKEAIRDLTRRLTELNGTARKLEENGFSVDALDVELTRMRDGLTKAQAAIESNNIREAVLVLRTVDEHLDKVQAAITMRMREHNQRRASSYQTALVNRYNTMRETLTTLQNLNSDRVSVVLVDINKIEGKLDTARNLYREGDITGSIRALHQADRDFKEAFSRINGEETRSLMRSLDKLTSQLETESSQANRLRLRRRIQSAKDLLASRLEEDISEPTRPISGATNDSLSETLTS